MTEVEAPAPQLKGQQDLFTEVAKGAVPPGEPADHPAKIRLHRQVELGRLAAHEHVEGVRGVEPSHRLKQGRRVPLRAPDLPRDQIEQVQRYSHRGYIYSVG